MNPPFWNNRNVLITGHTGFKGSWLAMWLQLLGARVSGYSLLPPTQPNLFNAAKVGEGMESVQGDVRELEALREAVDRILPEVVIHMAAQSLVRASYRDPVETYATNVMGTVHVFEAARKCDSVRAVVNVTSDKCYENSNLERGYREDDPMGGHDPYSSSKGCAELVTSAFRRSFLQEGTHDDAAYALASARGGNVVGGGDWAEDRLIPDLIRAFMADKPAKIRNPESVRPWQHVLEPLHGYLLLAEKLYEEGGEFAEGWNFGPGDKDANTVGWVAARASELWGGRAQVVADDNTAHPHEARYLRLDAGKARSRLGWMPVLDIETTLEWTVEWYKSYENEQNVRRVAERQIERFVDHLEKR